MNTTTKTTTTNTLMKIALACGLGVSALVATPAIADAFTADSVEDASPAVTDFVEQWEEDTLTADLMRTDADGKMLTLIDEDTNIEVQYFLTVGDDIYRNEMSLTTRAGGGGVALDEAEGAEGAEFAIDNKEVTVSLGDEGDFSIAREQPEA